MDKDKPPSCGGSQCIPFLVGKDSRGHWVVKDQNGRRGGIFAARADALKYAMFENGNRPQAVTMVPGILELNVETKDRENRPASAIDRLSLRHVA